MNEERIRMYCEQLFADIVMAQECLDCAQEMGNRLVNNEEIFHENIFWLARSSFLYTGTIILCKAIEGEKSDSPLSIFQIIKWAKSTLKLTSAESCEFQQRIDLCDMDIITRLHTQRDKFYAHNDKNSLKKVEESCSVTHQDKIKVITWITQMLYYIISLCNHGPYCAHCIVDTCKPELDKVMHEVSFMNRNKQGLHEFIRWCRNNDKSTT